LRAGGDGEPELAVKELEGFVAREVCLRVLQFLSLKIAQGGR